MKSITFDALALSAASATRRRAALLLASGVMSALITRQAPMELFTSTVEAKRKKKGKKKKNKNPGGAAGTGTCTSPNSPNTLTCTMRWAGCGGSHQCCQCRTDLSGQLHCMSHNEPSFPPCGANGECAPGYICDDYAKSCHLPCTL